MKSFVFVLNFIVVMIPIHTFDKYCKTVSSSRQNRRPWRPPGAEKPDHVWQDGEPALHPFPNTGDAPLHPDGTGQELLQPAYNTLRHRRWGLQVRERIPHSMCPVCFLKWDSLCPIRSIKKSISHLFGCNVSRQDFQKRVYCLIVSLPPRLMLSSLTPSAE